MLIAADEGTIRNAILKRLGKEPGTAVADILVEDHGDHIKVGVWVLLEDTVQLAGLIDIRARFDLPAEFEHSHLLNEIDEIAEACKEARRKAGIALLIAGPGKREPLTGTGLRGRW